MVKKKVAAAGVLAVLTMLIFYRYLIPGPLVARPVNAGLQVELSWRRSALPLTYLLEKEEGRKTVVLGQTTAARWVDSEVVSGKTYLYRLSAPARSRWWRREAKVEVPDEFASSRQALYRRLDAHFFPSSGGGAEKRWIYDDALGVLVYCRTGEKDKARRILAELASRQGKDGAINFFYFTDNRATERYIRSGSLAWVGYAAAVYQLSFSDPSFQPMAEKIAAYLLELRGEDGLVRGGEGTYLPGGGFKPGPVEWAAAEHNIDTCFFLQALAKATGKSSYAREEQKVGQALEKVLWLPKEGRLRTGTGEDRPALDVVSWGGLYFLAKNDAKKVRASLDGLKAFALPGGGYSYEPGGTLWLEGSWGAFLLRLRCGEEVGREIRFLARRQEELGGGTVSDAAWGFLVLGGRDFLLSKKFF